MASKSDFAKPGTTLRPGVLSKNRRCSLVPLEAQKKKAAAELGMHPASGVGGAAKGGGGGGGSGRRVVFLQRKNKWLPFKVSKFVVPVCFVEKDVPNLGSDKFAWILFGGKQKTRGIVGSVRSSPKMVLCHLV